MQKIMCSGSSVNMWKDPKNSKEGKMFKGQKSKKEKVITFGMGAKFCG